MTSSSSSSLPAFHTLISVAMLPYNQSFIVSFVVVVFSRCCESDVEKEKKNRLKKKETILQLKKRLKKLQGQR